MAPIPPSPALTFVDAQFNNISPKPHPQPQPPLVDLAYSSLELDDRVDVTLFPRDAPPSYAPGAGAVSPQAFNNSGMLALFAIIGTAMVVASIWFFFWAKNGGFHFQQGDWDDYKSTVLRRKGPDGRTLSNATKSTKLGGSTIVGTQHYKWQQQAAKSVVGRDDKGRKGILGKRGWAGTHSVTYSDADDLTDTLGTQTVSDITEMRTVPDHSQHAKRYRDRDVQQYKREKPARVGGLNRVADGSHFGHGSEVMSESSEQRLHSQPKDKGTSKERAERKAREEAARMERRWKKEAEEAAAALAHDSAHHDHHARESPPKKSAPAASRPGTHKQRHSASRSASPKKAARNFSYQAGQESSEALRTACTGTHTTTTNTRAASYYEEYRPRASENPCYSADHGNRSRQSSPKKGGAGRQTRGGNGYRRGADSDLD